MKTVAPIALAAIAALLATACSPAKGKADAPGKAPAASAAADQAEPAAATTALPNADGAVWTFFQTEEGTHLAYAVPDSDDVTNYFVCQTGSGTLQASLWADHEVPGQPGAEARSEMTQLTLTSGAVSKSYEAAAEGEEMYGGAQVTAMDVGLSDAVIAEFAKTGVIQMGAYGEKTKMPAAPLADVQKLLKACKKT